MSFPIQDHKEKIRQLNMAFLGAFFIVGLVLVFWSVVRANWLLARDDNPRLVEAALRIQRGTIFDANNVVLAETFGEDRVTRKYHPASGAAVGYYSLQYGTAGVEEGFDALLRGDSAESLQTFIRETTHQPQQGRNVRLTLDARWQATADELLGEKGAIVLMSVPDVAIRALVSHPSYDANNLALSFDALVADNDAPLLNRAAQGQYQPGTVLMPFVMAAALDENRLNLDGLLSADTAQTVAIGTNTLDCVTAIELRTWRDVLQGVCPAPLQQLATNWNASRLTQLLTAFGLTEEVALAIPTDVPVGEPLTDARLAIVGQENLTVTPLQVARAWTGLVRQGQLQPLQLVAAIQAESGEWVVELEDEGGREMVSAESAQKIIAALPTTSSIIEHTALALAGPEGNTNAWYLGFAPADSPRFAVVVVVEDGDIQAAQETGRGILGSVLSP